MDCRYIPWALLPHYGPRQFLVLDCRYIPWALLPHYGPRQCLVVDCSPPRGFPTITHHKAHNNPRRGSQPADTTTGQNPVCDRKERRRPSVGIALEPSLLIQSVWLGEVEPLGTRARCCKQKRKRFKAAGWLGQSLLGQCCRHERKRMEATGRDAWSSLQR